MQSILLEILVARFVLSFDSLLVCISSKCFLFLFLEMSTRSDRLDDRAARRVHACRHDVCGSARLDGHERGTSSLPGRRFNEASVSSGAGTGP